MSASVFSPLWYRVATLKPRLGTGVRVERQTSRGTVWHLLFDAQRGRALRLNAAAYAFAARLDGRRTVQDIWDALTARDDDSAPTQDEAIEILWRLHARRLLETDAQADLGNLFEETSRDDARAVRRRLNPLSFVVPLGDPTRILKSLEGVAHRLFSWPMLIAWMLFVGYGVVLAVTTWSTLEAHAAKWVLTPYYVTLALVLYPIIKAFHELAHGLAMRRFGCDTNAAGISLFFLMPLPFVDASSVAALPRARERIVVGAAGIMAELFIASAAIVCWFNVQPGVLRDIAFVTAFTASVSTLLVNANPLLRFDGYYVFSDALDLPNLATRSARYWGDLLQRTVLRVKPVKPFVPARGERIWLFLYAPASLAYRLALFTALTVWAGTFSFVVGVAVAIAFAVTLLLPLATVLHAAFFRAGIPARHRTRAAAIAIGVGLAAIIVLFAVPAPFATVAPGVVWLNDDARLRAETEGFVTQIAKRHGERVSRGEVVLMLENPRITAEHDQLTSRIAALEPELYTAARREAIKAANAAAEIEQLRRELARSEERVAGLTVRAGTDGTLVLPRGDDLIGTFARKGAMLGHILTKDPAVVRVAVPEEEAALISTRLKSVDTRLSSAISEKLHGELVRDAVGATTVLPSAALSVRHGGSVLTEPDDKEGLKPLSPIVLMDVTLPERGQDRFGERAWVRFDLGASPLAQQWYRRARQVLLRQFNPST